MNIIELFSGEESFSKVAASRRHRVFTVDSKKSFKPTYVADVKEVHRKFLTAFWYPDLIWASPPCQGLTVATIGRNWTVDHRPKTKKAIEASLNVIHTMRLIYELNPRFWIIENPRGKLRRLPFINNEYRHTVTYCQYGDDRMKPTDIWTNLPWTPRPMCKNGDSCHESAPRGTKQGTQGRSDSVARSLVPKELCLELLKIAEFEMGESRA